MKNVSAAQLVPLLRPLVPQRGHLAAYPNGNILIISDRASNVSRIMKIIERMDESGGRQRTRRNAELFASVPSQRAKWQILTTLYNPLPPMRSAMPNFEAIAEVFEKDTASRVVLG